MGKHRRDAEYKRALLYRVALRGDPILALRQTAAERLLAEIELDSPMRDAWRARERWDNGEATRRP